jgi:hypothetical protein
VDFTKRGRRNDMKSLLAELLSEETWYNKVAFLIDISQALNTLDEGM